MRFLFIILISFIGYGQDTLELDSVVMVSSNNITGQYSRTSGVQYTLSYQGDNSITRKSFSLNTATSYSLVYGGKVIGNELQEKTNISYKNFFVIHVYNHSLTRGITNDNSFGIGYIYKFKYLSLSYGSLYQNTVYLNVPHNEVFRHSFRVKFKYRTKHFGIVNEYYYQPNMFSTGDVIIYGNTKISLFQNRRVNFTINDNINYRSLSKVKLIHSLMFGIGFNFMN
jgi:hypothetical protein